MKRRTVYNARSNLHNSEWSPKGAVPADQVRKTSTAAANLESHGVKDQVKSTGEVHQDSSHPSESNSHPSEGLGETKSNPGESSGEISESSDGEESHLDETERPRSVARFS